MANTVTWKATKPMSHATRRIMASASHMPNLFPERNCEALRSESDVKGKDRFAWEE